VACTQRRRRAIELLEQHGLTVQEIARKLRLTVPRVNRLLEEEAQIRDLQQYKCDSVPVEQIHALLLQRQEEDPTLTKERIARLADYGSRTALLRALGLEPTARMLRRGREYPPEHRKRIDVGAAGRIVRALGFAPHEIPDL
jgi:transcriptional regulator with XRE-family HTH domain